MAKIVICFACSDGNFCFIAKGYALLVYVFFSWTFFNIVVVVFVVVVVVIIKDIIFVYFIIEEEYKIYDILYLLSLQSHLSAYIPHISVR